MRFAIPAAVVVLLAMLWGAVLLATTHLRQSTLAEASAARRNVARSVAESQASSVRAIDGALVRLRETWEGNRVGFERAVTVQEELLHKEKAIQVAVVDRDGWLRYSRTPVANPINFSDREYFGALRDGGRDELVISTPVLGRVTHRWAIQFARGIFGPDGRFDGMVVVAVPPPALEELFNDMDLGADAIMTLARDDGRILARNSRFEQSVEVPLRPVAAGQVEGEFEGTGRVDGVRRFVSFRNVPDYPLRVYVGQSVATVLAPFERQRAYLMALAAAASLLMTAVAYVGAARARERSRFVEERERLMLELHDGCIQALYAIGLNLDDVQAGGGGGNALARVQADLNLVIQDLRAFINGERGVRLGPEQFVEEIRKSAPAGRPPVLRVDVDGDAVLALQPEQAAHVLRIVREAVSNVVRHARAGVCTVSLERTPERRVRLDVRDDGCGIGGEAPGRGSLGLAHIQARAKRIGGEARVSSGPGAGTTVTVEFPVTP